MSGKTRTSLLSLTIIAVIVFSAFGTTTVYADGDPPPDPPPIEATTSPEEGSTEANDGTTKVAAEETSAPEEAAPEAATPEVTAEAISTPEKSSTEEVMPPPTAEAAPVVEEATPAPEASVLDQVPENTTVVVLDANGEAQPLATEAAAEAVATSDPIWCAETALVHTPGATGCTGSFSSFTDLLGFLSDPANQATYSGAGTIYVEQGSYQGGESIIDFNAYSLTNISNASLTITGGWDPTTGGTDSTNSSTFNNTSIIIGASGNPWGGSLTVNNLSLDFSNNSNSGTGLTLYSQSDITLSNVDVTNSWNGAGAELDAGGSVTILDSNFTRNKTAGAIIRSQGDVGVLNSSFSNPEDARRQNTGLDITSTGSVSLLNVLANENRLVGANINAGGGVSITRSVFSGTEEIQGANFLGYGLQVTTPSAVALNNVTANNNFLWGASLTTTTPAGNISIVDSVFNANTTASPGFIDDTGLFIFGGGNVAMSNVTANDNRLHGANINALGTVTINNGSFSNNRGVTTAAGVDTFHGHGLQITSPLGIFLSNVTATNNMLFGAELNSGAEVAISFSNFSNTSTGSSANAVGQGLDIISAGNVSLLDVVLDNNQTMGANIQAGGNVTLNNVTATNNGTDGVVVQGLCAEVIGGTFTGNGGLGLNLGTTPACASLLSAGTTASAGPFNVFASLQIAPQQSANTSGTSIPVTGASIAAVTDTSAGNVTLNSLMANIKTMTGGTHLSIFTGKYAYVYSSSGMHIIAFSPSSNGIAMAGPYKAY